jgi:hypothetical protein
MFILLVQVGLKQGKELRSEERCPQKTEYSPNYLPLSFVVYSQQYTFNQPKDQN